MATRRVLILGASGVIGAFMARRFAEAGWAVQRAGRRPARDADFVSIDLDHPDRLAAACATADLTVNCVRHRSLVAEHTVLAEGGMIINVADDDPPARARASLEARNPKGLVFMGGGMATVALLAAAALIDEHPDADRVDLGITFYGFTTTGPAGADYVHRVLARSPHHETVRVTLPAPFGRRAALRVELGPDDFWRSALPGRRAGQVALLWPRPFQALMTVLNGLRLNRRLPRAAIAFGRKRMPKHLSREPVCWWVSAHRSHDLLASYFLTGQGDYRMTIAATVAVAEALLDRRARGTIPQGVFGPRELLTLDWATNACAGEIGIARSPAAS